MASWGGREAVAGRPVSGSGLSPGSAGLTLTVTLTLTLTLTVTLTLDPNPDPDPNPNPNLASSRGTRPPHWTRGR